jgi:hypothetical protein
MSSAPLQAHGRMFGTGCCVTQGWFKKALKISVSAVLRRMSARLVVRADGGFRRRPEAAAVRQALVQLHEPQVGRGVAQRRRARRGRQEGRQEALDGIVPALRLAVPDQPATA